MAEEKHMWEAIELSRRNIQQGVGGPFAAVIVRNGSIVARGTNLVTSTNDPTAHAEIVAIRAACRSLKTFQLSDCEIYTTCEPCPMCLGAIYWARLKAVVYANTRRDAAAIGFDDEFLYHEFTLPLTDRKISLTQMLRHDALQVFQEWAFMEDKTRY
ncbi:MAG: nucleoside deaminase [Ignavibacteriales bacterium]|nr:nucleoside deaminase [Ignavibacteriales bacterium]